MENVLVIGGAGFVGSNLCKRLLKQNLNVCSYDNYFTGLDSNHHSSVDYFEGDTIDINNVDFGRCFSHIYHLGEYSRVEQSFDDIDIVFKFNMQSIYPVLKFVKHNNAKLIYSGSSTKYGANGENSTASPYAWTKKTNSELVKVFCEWNNLDYAISYFYNVYGDNELSEGKYSTLIGKYMNLIASGESKLPVVSPGSQTRNFTDVRDIVEGLYLIGKDGYGDEYGIGSDQSYSVLDIVKMFNCEAFFLSERKGNRMSAPLKTKKTKSLGWECKFNLPDYIKKKLSKN